MGALQAMSPRGRIVLAVSALGIVFVAFMLFRIASSPSYTTLQAGVDPAKTGKSLADLGAGTTQQLVYGSFQKLWDREQPDVVVHTAGSKIGPAIDQIQASQDRSQVGWIVIAVAAALSLLFARRRSTGLVWLGAGAVGVAAVLKLVTSVGVPNILDNTPSPSGFATTLQKLLADRAADSLGQWLLWLALGGLAAIVAGVFFRASSGKN
jgi:hypothetical protein